MFEILWIVVCACIIYLVGFLNGRQWGEHETEKRIYEEDK